MQIVTHWGISLLGMNELKYSICSVAIMHAKAYDSADQSTVLNGKGHIFPEGAIIPFIIQGSFKGMFAYPVSGNYIPAALVVTLVIIYYYLHMEIYGWEIRVLLCWALPKYGDCQNLCLSSSVSQSHPFSVPSESHIQQNLLKPGN